MTVAKRHVASFFVTDESTGEQYTLFSGAMIGRLYGDHQFESDPRMSGTHAKFTIAESEVFVEDVGSRNGVFINGKQIDANVPTRILPGDILQMGNHHFSVGRGPGTPIAPMSPPAKEDTRTTLLSKLKKVKSPSPPMPKTKSGPFPIHLQASQMANPADALRQREDDESEARYSGALHSLTGVLIAFFALMTMQGSDPLRISSSDLLRWGANFGPQTTGGEAWRLVAALFLQHGAPYLLGLLPALWQVGKAIGNKLSGIGILAVFIASGIIGNIAFLVVHPEIVNVGTGGSIFGLHGALLAIAFRDRQSLQIRSKVIFGLSLIIFLVSLIPSVRVWEDGIEYAIAFASGLVFTFMIVPSQPLSPLARRLRAWLLLLICAGALAGAPPYIKQIENQTEALLDIHSSLMTLTDRYDAISTRVAGAQINATEFATIIQSELIPKVRQLHNHLEQMPKFTDRRLQIVLKLNNALKYWEESWHNFAEGMPASDVGLLQRASDAERIARDNSTSAEALLKDWKYDGRE